ncbi:MAG TPA: response regulator [Ramlibacter sp.]
MAQRVFVKVVGFSAAERHALNTVFRLSEEREIMYRLWVWGAPEPPRLLLVDGESADAAAEPASGSAAAAKLVWVGAHAPPHAWRVVQRPIAWTEVLHGMDAFFGSGEALDFDLTDAMDTQPPDPVPQPRRALIASPDREQRLYLRARLALAGLAMVDEAETGPQALALASRQPYCLAIVEHHLPQIDAWSVLKRLREGVLQRPAVIVARSGGSLRDRLRARLRGAAAFIDTPVDPATLHDALQGVLGPPGLPPAALPVHEPTS